MRILSHACGQELELQLVQETSLSLTFQRDVLSNSRTVKQGWRQLVETLLLVGPCLVFGLLMMTRFLSTTSLASPISIAIPTVWAMLMIGVLVIVLIQRFYFKPRFIVWTLDRSTQQLLKTTKNLLGKKHRRFNLARFDQFKFSSILSVLLSVLKCTYRS